MGEVRVSTKMLPRNVLIALFCFYLILYYYYYYYCYYYYHHHYITIIIIISLILKTVVFKNGSLFSYSPDPFRTKWREVTFDHCF